MEETGDVFCEMKIKCQAVSGVTVMVLAHKDGRQVICRASDTLGHPDSRRQTVNCQLSTVNCQTLSVTLTVENRLSTVNCQRILLLDQLQMFLNPILRNKMSEIS